MCLYSISRMFMAIVWGMLIPQKVPKESLLLSSVHCVANMCLYSISRMFMAIVWGMLIPQKVPKESLLLSSVHCVALGICILSLRIGN